jgi:hypothetical protein
MVPNRLHGWVARPKTIERHRKLSAARGPLLAEKSSLLDAKSRNPSNLLIYLYSYGKDWS